MGVTYTSHHSREQRDGRDRRLGARARFGAILLVATSLVSIVAIALCFVGRQRAFEVTEQPNARSPVNLTDVTSAEVLEPALAAAFDQLR